MLIQLEAFKTHIQKLNNSCSSEDTVVVVEGKKDVEALKTILEADFFILNKGKKRSLYETAEVLAEKYSNAILLLDADPKGKELRRKMKSYLQMHGTSVVEDEKLLRLARVRTIESLPSAKLVRLL